MNYGPYYISECIIAATMASDGGVVLSKNRDRIYKANFVVRHEIKNGVEIVYIEDLETGWKEGMNEHGIGIVNTALMVDVDDKEKELIKKGKKGKSEDGDRMMKALGYSKLKEVLKSLITYDDGIKGHTFVSDGEIVYSIEATTEHKSIDKKLTLKKNDVIVRTNHGEDYEDSGYTKGVSRKSSEKRKEQAEEILNGDDEAKAILKKLRVQNFKKSSQLNMKRDTSEHITTSQMALDLNDRVVYIVPIEKNSEFKGIKTKLPKGYQPKITIKILDEK